VFGSDIEPDEIKEFNEKSASLSILYIEKGYELMRFFINKIV
jgi:2,3-bisphosphoglycerate-independent phosphoglycerate mutase